MQLEVDLAIKDKQMQTIELFGEVKLQSTIVFGLDDKPIAGIESILEVVTNSNLFITFNFVYKQKQEERSGLSHNIILLLEMFERSTTILTQVLFKAQELFLLPITSTLSTSNNFADNIEKKLLR